MTPAQIVSTITPPARKRSPSACSLATLALLPAAYALGWWCAILTH